MLESRSFFYLFEYGNWHIEPPCQAIHTLGRWKARPWPLKPRTAPPHSADGGGGGGAALFQAAAVPALLNAAPSDGCPGQFQWCHWLTAQVS